jgi:hypothetical protein
MFAVSGVKNANDAVFKNLTFPALATSKRGATRARAWSDRRDLMAEDNFFSAPFQ